ncbi:MAG: YcxB family protein [Lachnospiraceae bacterium]|nr:YcxB family protein [Lachnospiraceae bacterium]
MTPDSITISSRIDTKLFQDFALFDTFTRQKRYRSPLIFAGIMLVFSCICFAMKNAANQAVLLGGVLLGIGVLLPVFYFGNYFYSIRQQAKKMKLDKPKHVYTVSLTSAADGITIVSPTGEGGTLRQNWSDLFAAYRRKGCIYLFVTPQRAFLLPDGQANATPDELWAFLQSHMPPEKLFV